MQTKPERSADPQFISTGMGLLQNQPPRVNPPAPGKSSPQAMRKKPARLGRILVAVLLLMGVGLAAGMLPRMHKNAETRQESQELALATVRVAKPTASKSAEPITLSGELRPLMDAAIYARASGYVRKWNVDLGAQVQEGEVLAELDTPEIDRELAEARASLRQAAAAADLADATAKRWTKMLGAKTVSPQESDEKTGDLSVKQQALAAAQANVERVEKLAGFGKLVAPFAGTVTARKLDVGQLVNAGNASELFRIAETHKLRVFVRVPQTFARAVKEGQTAEIKLSELPGRTFPATIVRSAGALDAASRTLLTELEVDNSKGELLAGSYVQVRLADTLPEASLTVPSNALIFRSEGPQIALVANDNKVELRKVVLGRDFGAALEVLDGVSATEQVVINPPDSLVSGIEVRIAADEKQPASNTKQG